MIKIGKIAAMFALFTSPLQANAAFMQWKLEAEVTSVSPELSSIASIGDVIDFRYTFAPNTPDVEPGVIERGKYDNAISGFGIGLNGDNAAWHSTVGTGYIAVLNDYYGSDSYGLQASPVWDKALTGANGYSFYLVNLGINDTFAQIFNDTSILVDPFSHFSNFFLNLNFGKWVGPSIHEVVTIRSTKLLSAELVAVPEPNMFALLATGLALLLRFNRRVLGSQDFLFQQQPNRLKFSNAPGLVND